jgi:hypothetical protein
MTVPTAIDGRKPSADARIEEKAIRRDKIKCYSENRKAKSARPITYILGPQLR